MKTSLADYKATQKQEIRKGLLLLCCPRYKECINRSTSTAKVCVWYNCFAIADNILHNTEDSDECVNDTWLKAWNAIPPQRPNVLRMFLAKITRNLAFNRFNERSTQKRGGGEITFVLDELSECLAGRENVESAYEAAE